MNRTFTLLVVGLLLGVGSLSAQDSIDVWIGTSGPHGIYQFELDTRTGELSKPEKAADVGGAGFLVMNKQRTRLYSTGRHEGNVGYVASFEIKKNDAGKTLGLEALNTQEIGDSGAAHINLDQSGELLMTAQYGGSSIASFPVHSDGNIGERIQLIKHEGGSKVVGNRQDAPHPHWIGPSPNNSLVVVPDLGLDAMVVYKIADGKLQPVKQIKLPEGAGPRHMKFHPNQKWAYVLNELSLTVSVFDFDEAKSSFDPKQEIDSLPDELKDKHLNSGAEIRIHPNGRYLYTSNRGHDSITAYSIDQESGELTFMQRESIRGSWPRNFAIDPSGKWLLAAGRYSNTVSLFEIEEDGQIVFTRKVVNVPEPICVLFDLAPTN